MSCMGRLGCGVISDYMQRQHKVPRVAFFVGGSLASCGGMLLLALAHGSQFRLTVATILTGLSFGSMNTLLPACLADNFGMRHFAENMALVAAAAATLASYLFASVLFAAFYDEARQAQGGSGRQCEGAACVQKTALVCAVGSLVAALLGGWLVHRSPLRRTRPGSRT
jgi:MFS family permease